MMTIFETSIISDDEKAIAMRKSVELPFVPRTSETVEIDGVALAVVRVHYKNYRGTWYAMIYCGTVGGDGVEGSGTVEQYKEKGWKVSNAKK